MINNINTNVYKYVDNIMPEKFKSYFALFQIYMSAHPYIKLKEWLFY